LDECRVCVPVADDVEAIWRESRRVEVAAEALVCPLCPATTAARLANTPSDPTTTARRIVRARCSRARRRGSVWACRLMLQMVEGQDQCHLSDTCEHAENASERTHSRGSRLS
jgi:hypothetical protein